MLQSLPEKPTVGQLRELLQQRFTRSQPAAPGGWATGIPGIDGPLGGGLPRAAISEVVETRAGAGGQLLLIALLEAARQGHRFVALVDALDSFDPQSAGRTLLRHLLWVRSTGVDPALRAADLLARDNNMAVLVIDLREAPVRDLRRIQPTVWFRFQRVVEMTEMVLVVMTSQPIVSSARVRLELDAPFSLAALEQPRREALTDLNPRLLGRRFQEEAAG